jgi:hypothetical protein
VSRHRPLRFALGRVLAQQRRERARVAQYRSRLSRHDHGSALDDAHRRATWPECQSNASENLQQIAGSAGRSVRGEEATHVPYCVHL